MTVSFTWEFPHWAVATAPVNGHSGVIQSVAWRLTASDGEHKTVAIGNTALPPPPPEGADPKAPAFIPKEEVTEEVLIGWLKPLIGYEKYVENLTDHLTRQATDSPKAYYEPPAFAKKT